MSQSSIITETVSYAKNATGVRCHPGEVRSHFAYRLVVLAILSTRSALSRQTRRFAYPAILVHRPVCG
jgi:hypothetical protein